MKNKNKILIFRKTEFGLYFSGHIQILRSSDGCLSSWVISECEWPVATWGPSRSRSVLPGLFPRSWSHLNSQTTQQQKLPEQLETVNIIGRDSATRSLPEHYYMPLCDPMSPMPKTLPTCTWAYAGSLEDWRRLRCR